MAWARRAQWSKEESRLATALKKRIRGDVRIKIFPWSGRNFHCSRRRAALNLKKHIAATKEAFPDARHFLIAHSHGGVVALYALADPEIRSCVSAVICLATPFIISRARRYPEGAFGFLGFLYGCGVYALLSYDPPSWYPTQIPVLLAAILVTALSILFVRACLAWCVLGDLKGGFDATYYRVIESFSLPNLSSNELLVLRAAGDEASGILTTSAFASSVVATLSGFLQFIYSLGTVLSEICEELVGPETREVTLRKMIVFPVFFALTFAGLILRAIYLILAIPLLLLCIIFSVPFGVDAVLAALVVEFSVESTPIGRSPVVSLNAPTVKGLWHSLPYNDPEAFKAIVGWINSHREEGEQPIRLSDLALGIRNYAVSRSRFDWREVEDRLTAVEASHEKTASNLGLTATFSDQLVEGDIREPVRAISFEAADLFRTLRAVADLDVELQTKELEKVASRLDCLDKDLKIEIKAWNDNIPKSLG
jgi:hypothetical protein